MKNKYLQSCIQNNKVQIVQHIIVVQRIVERAMALLETDEGILTATIDKNSRVWQDTYNQHMRPFLLQNDMKRMHRVVRKLWRYKLCFNALYDEAYAEEDYEGELQKVNKLFSYMQNEYVLQRHNVTTYCQLLSLPCTSVCR